MYGRFVRAQLSDKNVSSYDVIAKEAAKYPYTQKARLPV